MSEHIVKSFEEELNGLASEVARMGALAESQLVSAIDAIASRDTALLTSVVGKDERLDAAEAEIEASAIRLVALRQPMANDLRRTLSAIKIAGNLERCGDLAKSIAKRGLLLSESEPVTPPLARSIERMGALVAERLRDVVDAYSANDINAAIAVWSKDEDVDQHYNSLFRELLTYMMGDPRTITPCAHLLFVAKNLERIGDHATNIAEIIHYELRGEPLSQQRPKVESL